MCSEVPLAEQYQTLSWVTSSARSTSEIKAMRFAFPLSLRVWTAFWLAALFWGTSFLWIKIGLEAWEPVSLVALRLTFASGLFAAFLLFRKPRVVLVKRHLWVVPVVAFLNPYVPFLLITWAETRIESGMASILNATVPLFMLVLTPLFLREERPNWLTFLGTSIGFMGVAILFGNPFTQVSLAEAEHLKGLLAVLLASFLYAISAVLMKRFPLGVPALVQAALMNFTACLFVWLHVLLSSGWAPPSQTHHWASALWLGAFGSFGAYTLAMYVMEKRGAFQTTLINFAYPLLGMCLGCLFLKEPFHSELLIGGLLIISGIGLPRWRYFVVKPRWLSQAVLGTKQGLGFDR
jgi:drug/metabolite transporter (DMT)-like permease